MAEIMTKNTPWEGHTGTQVESFIKGSLGKLIGVIYKDADFNEYLCFNDEQDRDTYLANPSREDLVLARFDASVQSHVATINLISTPADRVEIGSTGNVITFSFSIKDLGGVSTGEIANITYNISNTSSGSVVTLNSSAKVGTTTSLNIDDYLQVGENIIKITVRGQSTNAVASANVTCVAYSDAPTETVIISGVSALIEGNSTQYIAIADSVPTSATWSIVGTASGASIDPSSGILSTTKTGVTRGITIRATIASGATATKAITIQKEQSAATGVTTIRINQNETDPDGMITLISDDRTAIDAIRANSHRYLGKLTGAKEMTICQLWDSDSNYYHDKSTVADLAGGHGDVFMRLPKFYYKAVETTADSDTWEISFSYDEQSTADGWKVWDDSWLIGVYQLSGNGMDGYKSVSGAAYVYNSCSVLRQQVYEKGNYAGYSLVDWTHHCIMAFLFFAQYRTTNSQAVCGNGGSYYSKPVTGATDSLGMTDTVADGNTYQRVNFWGLEDWWGGFYEWLGAGSVTYDSQNKLFNWTIGDTSFVTPFTFDGFYISRLVIGSDLNAGVKEMSSNASETTGYCDEAVISTQAQSFPILRGGYGYNSGITSLSALYVSSEVPSANTTGSRLAFKGAIVEENDITKFINLTTNE